MGAYAGGGGGAGGAGGNASSGNAGSGGAGFVSNISGVSTTYAAGGAGGFDKATGYSSTLPTTQNGTTKKLTETGEDPCPPNTGHGGNGSNHNDENSGAGGSGIVIVRYSDTGPAASATTGSPTVTVAGGYRIYSWTTSGSITFAAAGAPANTSTPVISGTIVGIGNVLTCSTGSWTSDSAITYTYQWKRNGTNISVATANTYTTVNDDAWQTITCMVTATNSVSSGASTSNSLSISVITNVPIDNQFGFGPVLTPTIINGANITVAEPTALSIGTATAIIRGDDYTDLTKIAMNIVNGANITVAESTALALNVSTARIIGDDFTNLTSLAATFATTYAVTDGVPITTGNNSGSGSGTTTTLSQLWYMG